MISTPPTHTETAGRGVRKFVSVVIVVAVFVNPSPPKPPIPARLESNFLSVDQDDESKLGMVTPAPIREVAHTQRHDHRCVPVGDLGAAGDCTELSDARGRRRRELRG